MKEINPDFYEKIKISRYNIEPIKKISDEDLKESGYIFLPYVSLPHNTESLKEYDEFMDDYDKKHQVCPICGSDDYISTLMGYVLDSDNPQDYKDLNQCTCQSCGDIHTYHDMISEEEYKLKKENNV